MLLMLFYSDFVKIQENKHIFIKFVFFSSQFFLIVLLFGIARTVMNSELQPCVLLMLFIFWYHWISILNLLMAPSYTNSWTIIALVYAE